MLCAILQWTILQSKDCLCVGFKLAALQPLQAEVRAALELTKTSTFIQEACP